MRIEMRQWLQLPSTWSMTFRDVFLCGVGVITSCSVTPPTPAASMADLDLCSMKPVFMEDFKNQSIASSDLGHARWIAHTPWNGDFGDAIFTDPGPGGPFAVVDGMLSIKASKSLDGRWRSGLISAGDASGQGEGVQFGYFESRLKLPTGPGTWPAFWLGTLRPANANGPGIELDVMEYYGNNGAAYQTAVHVWYKDPALSRHEAHIVPVPDLTLTQEFHTFGVRVSTDIMTFYLDRRPVWQVDTPPELQLPLFPLVDLALGSGFPTDRTPDPSVLFVNYVHVYALDPAGKSGSCSSQDLR